MIDPIVIWIATVYDDGEIETLIDGFACVEDAEDACRNHAKEMFPLGIPTVTFDSEMEVVDVGFRSQSRKLGVCPELGLDFYISSVLVPRPV